MIEWLGITEAARIAGVSTSALRRAARIGTLEATRIGARSYAVTRDALAAYIAYVTQRGWRTDRPGGRPRSKGKRRRRS